MSFAPAYSAPEIPFMTNRRACYFDDGVVVGAFVMECRMVSSNCNEWEIGRERDQPAIIKEWFDIWCGEASVKHNLHPDDDRDELWAQFCLEVAL